MRLLVAKDCMMKILFANFSEFTLWWLSLQLIIITRPVTGFWSFLHQDHISISERQKESLWLISGVTVTGKTKRIPVTHFRRYSHWQDKNNPCDSFQEVQSLARQKESLWLISGVTVTGKTKSIPVTHFRRYSHWLDKKNPCDSFQEVQSLARQKESLWLISGGTVTG